MDVRKATPEESDALDKPVILGVPYGEMPDVPTALKCARHIIAVEKRWAEGVLIANPGAKDEPTCTNVSVCAVGALVLVLGDGPVIHSYFSNDGNDFEGEGNFLQAHPIGGPAVDLLARAVAERDDVHVRPVKPGSTRWSTFARKIGVIESFNDRLDEDDECIPVAEKPDSAKEHLNNVISVFDRAIELAESDAPATA